MTETRNVHAAAGAALGLLGVGLGAFGAHGLEDFMQSAENATDRIEWWATATEYHLVHSVAMVALAWKLADHRPIRPDPAAMLRGFLASYRIPMNQS